jgi:23S rRNA pseudouridine2604 synthase
MEKVRISKLMAEQGLCSRREADAFIEKGWVKLDGQVVVLGERAFPDQKITLDRPAAQQQSQSVTILIHKPMGYVSGQAEDGYTPAVALLEPKTRWALDRAPFTFSRAHLRGLAVAGRLDIDSTGLLVLTQDGRVARQLIGEHSLIDKEYLVRVQGKLSENGLALLNHGLSLDGKKLKPAKVRWQNDDQLQFVLNEGKKRQIRRMCDLVGLKVVGLKRVRIGQVRLGDLPPGQWRYLSPKEEF